MQPTTAGLTPLARRCIAAGALLMLLGVILGAFGAHALQALLSPQRLASYQTGVTYQLLHSLGLVAVGIVAKLTSETTRLPVGFPIRKSDGALGCTGCHVPHGSDNLDMWYMPEENDRLITSLREALPGIPPGE